jgi:hypothetical protein
VDFPLIENAGAYYPKEAVCPWCKKSKIFEPHSFAVLGGGALLQARDGSAGPSEKMEGFFHLSWHGAHSNDGGEGKDPDIVGTVDIVRNVQGGQFEIYFCSTECLRNFLNYCVDSLEIQLQK